uniref:Uncharacterized protein n=1 Tax=Arundo donax TaxID=35708 RepID=A0A0A8XZ36_ARUDO
MIYQFFSRNTSQKVKEHTKFLKFVNQLKNGITWILLKLRNQLMVIWRTSKIETMQ